MRRLEILPKRSHNSTVYALQSKGRFAIHREYNLISWKMWDAPDFLEPFRTLDVGITKAQLIDLICYSTRWGHGPNGEMSHRDLSILRALEKWVSCKAESEHFFICPDIDAEAWPNGPLDPDDFQNETEW